MAPNIDIDFLFELVFKQFYDDAPDITEAFRSGRIEQQVNTWCHPTCNGCLQQTVDKYYMYSGGGYSFCPDCWSKLLELLNSNLDNPAFLNNLKYRSAIKSMKIAYDAHGRHLLNSMEFLVLWCDDHIKTGHKVWFCGRDMDIFYHLMKKVYGYGEEIQYLGGWSRDFMDHGKPSNKAAMVKHLGIEPGDAVVDSGFNGSVPNDIKKYVDVRAMVLTKNSPQGCFPWIEYYSALDTDKGASKYRDWMVDVEHEYKGKTVVCPTAPDSIAAEMWDENDIVGQMLWEGRALAYRVALKKAIKHDLRRQKKQLEKWLAKASCKEECEKCFCTCCASFDHCAENKGCKDKYIFECENKVILPGDCGSYTPIHIDPLAGAAGCVKCWCKVCDKLHSCTAKSDVDACWNCQGSQYSYQYNCYDFQGDTTKLQICAQCKCFDCEWFNTIHTNKCCHYTSKNLSKQCTQYFHASCPQYKKKSTEPDSFTCDSCLCSACGKAGVECYCNLAKHGFKSVKCADKVYSCGSLTPKAAVVPPAPECNKHDCVCQDCKKVGDGGCKCMVANWDTMYKYAVDYDFSPNKGCSLSLPCCNDFESKHVKEEHVTVIPTVEPSTVIHTNFMKLDWCKDCKCPNCCTVCDENACVDCDCAIQHCTKAWVPEHWDSPELPTFVDDDFDF